ncbi:SpoIIE family protein phosphatase [Streptomyces rugosispiralis]|uniref:SpoIIE family protein phosphatase n=1 Tax=Streptomyces rugosispiralis TaxID=2967341 RepID=A0ABT1URY4_9ACTN|nr:SpoIIE family protein phosphatase [Streptomyces rugosispiralis]MCQ8187884.1 SpoIIE family protein phosphatase [Streptomyces rugosispiralis]
MFVLQVAIIMVLAVGAVLLLVVTVQRETTQNASDRSLAIAEGFAHSPGIVEALKSPRPTAVLQPRTEAARKSSGVAAIVIVNRDGVRYTHPQPKVIGQRWTAQQMAPLLAGRTVRTEAGHGTLGPVFSALVPVKDRDGSVVGAVGASVTVGNVNSMVARHLPGVFGAAAAAVAVTTGGAAVLSRRLMRQTRNLGPTEITRLYEHHDAVLHAAREGVVIVDADGCLLLANDEARRLLGLPLRCEGRPVRELGLALATAELLASGREATDEVHLAGGGRVLAVNQRSLDRYGGPPGSVATIRDSTELQALSGRAKAARDRLKALYDASAGIGTTLDVTRTAEELAEVAVPQFADFVTVDLAEPILLGEEPTDIEKQLRRVAARGIREDIPPNRTGGPTEFASSAPQARCLNLGHAIIEPDAHTAPGSRTQQPQSTGQLTDTESRSVIAAPLCARGVALGVASFWRSQKLETFDQDDLVLAQELAVRAAVCIDNARRYTREHAMAVTLQRSLLPRDLPEQNALDIAYRYLPAQDVGGDWFDVIPLPGARVALVVGDVVGQGLHAAATMGRLRTAVRNFSTLDLPPDELLARLDELDDGGEGRGEGRAEADDATLGATCLYAIYDPVERRCTMARAGHPPPALVYPDCRVEFLELPAGPPLGLGGFPFATTEVDIPEGSKLVLYTDGLVEDRDRDIDESLDILGNALSHVNREPEETCGAVIGALLPRRFTDDIALLVARTHALPMHQIARWDVPRDPAAVAQMRATVADQLVRWGLEDLGFITELILSELITNAIRYATGPISVRLLLDRKLICEISDGSSTSPHLRYAETTDEGGRGLFLVAQLAERWGTRYTPNGKVIWAEQSLSDEYSGV